MATYQWIINFTSTSAVTPIPPPHQAVVAMVGKLYTSPSGVWLAGPQSVDDGVSNPQSSVWQWTISLFTTSTAGPTLQVLQTELLALFGPTVSNVWLAGPQSVDDGPTTESKSA